MNKLTAKKCLERIDKLKTSQRRFGISIFEEEYLEALEIALPVLEQQEHESVIAEQLEAVRDSLTLNAHQDAIITCAINRLNKLSRSLLEQQEKGELVWIYWDGESALPPVKDNVLVEIRMRSGNRMSGPAKTMRWRSYAPHPGDIVAYRVLEPQEMITDNQSVITDSAGMITDSAGLGDGWIEWKGGKQPIADSREVAIKFRDGTVMTETLSDCWVWSHGGDDDDIIAYRLVEQERERGKE
ncbi:hypothetical protein [Pantoea septica]|uniref:hypothetical protein n=1 Tax=Pantoea septica TaxID=472695 RepID=UPI0023F61D5D|nr:hypothetical protein [Pantoea septica]